MNSKSAVLLLLLFNFLLYQGCKPTTGFQELKYGAVSSAAPEATRAGMEILKMGGNAVDAAIAISFTLGVTEPAMSGIGGGTQVLLKLPGKNPISINGSTISPAITPVEWTKDSLLTYKKSTIPSTVRVLEYLYNNYGSETIKWQQLLQSSIKYARDGFKFGIYRSKVLERNREKMLQGMPSSQNYLTDSTYHFSKNDNLLKALEIIAANGADAFYSGEIATSIGKDMQANGGWIREHDLNSFPDPEEVTSVHFTYKGFDIYTQPEPCGGWIVKEIIQELERLEKSNSSDNFHTILAQAIQYGHELRKRNARVLVKELSSGETTHFSVIDKDGMAVSVTASINAYYGAGVANPDYGFLYNSYMTDFNYEESDNNYAVGPGKMAYSSMSPTIVLKDGEVQLIIGSPGSARIISTVAQLVAQYCSGIVDPSQLHKIERIHAIDGKLIVESDSLFKLYTNNVRSVYPVSKAKETILIRGLNPYFGGVHAIVKTNEGYQALADVRRDGLALAK